MDGAVKNLPTPFGIIKRTRILTRISGKIHVAYKVAGEHSDRYYGVLKKYKDIAAAHITENLYQRHICTFVYRLKQLRPVFNNQDTGAR